MTSFPVTRVAAPKEKPAIDKLGFGTLFTDHMFVMDYTEGRGWHDARIEPYGPLTMDPSTMVFHYGQAIFEGLKAYKLADGKVGIFRLESYMARMNRSAKVVCIPAVDEVLVADGIKALVDLEREWVPASNEASLYIRPFIISTDPYLGVRPSKTYKLMVILSPVGAYYPEGFKPVKILVSDKYVRAVRGGVGTAKTPANYAASLRAAVEAQAIGYTQVLWLDGVEFNYVEEVGTMNIFFVIGDRVITPPLEGSILGGITRDSVLRITRDWGLRVEEYKLSIDEVYEASRKGELKEIFGTGTAAVISPVSQLYWKDQVAVPGDGTVGQLSQKLYDYITGTQYGLLADERNWVTRF